MFEQRYTCPESTNPYYRTQAGNGYNKCIAINGYFVLANCTGYAYGRFMECAGVHACRLSTGNAQDWYSYPDGYIRSAKPEIGAVMCWGNKPGTKYGHVAFVEEVFVDGSVTASMSNWSEDGSLPIFERRTYKPPYNSPTGLPFQGFILNPYLGRCEIKPGSSDITISGHSYSVFRQTADLEAVVLSAGINNLAPIQLLDSERYTYAKATGANYFQMRSGQADPVGTTYGDQSAPLNGAFMQLPNQDSTLFFDLHDGSYGDCTGVEIDPSHNVFSPAVVYPAVGNFQYARMVGVDHVNVVSRYTFLIRLIDGTYILGICNQDSTPKTIAADFKQICGGDLDSISFLDGGGSAQFGRWDGEKFEYVRDTGRECPSAVAFVSKYPPQTQEPQPEPDTPQDTPQEPETKPEQPEEPQPDQNTGGDNMSEIQPGTSVNQIPNWTDPETQKTDVTIYDRIVALMSVKSIITIVCLGLFSFLTIQGKIEPDQFMTIFTAVIMFYFGVTFQKGSKG